MDYTRWHSVNWNALMPVAVTVSWSNTLHRFITLFEKKTFSRLNVNIYNDLYSITTICFM